MKGLVLKVKLIYFMSAWSQSCSVIFWECDSDSRLNGPPNSALTDITVNKRRQQHRPPFAKMLGALWAPKGNSWHRGAPRGGRQPGRRRMVQSSGHKTCPTKTQHSPSLHACHWEEAPRGSQLLKPLQNQCVFYEKTIIRLFQHKMSLFQTLTC